MSRKSNRGRKSRPQTKRHYPRTARLNSLFQQIVAAYFERVEDEQLDFITVTGVEVDNDLNKAQVFISTLDVEDQDPAVLEILGKHRIAVQSAIASQTSIRKTPEVVFLYDPAVREAARIENILGQINNGTNESDAYFPDDDQG